MFSIVVLNKIIVGGIIIAVIIMAVVGLLAGFDQSEISTIDDTSTNQEQNIPKKITLELSDGFNMGEAAGP